MFVSIFSDYIKSNSLTMLMSDGNEEHGWLSLFLYEALFTQPINQVEVAFAYCCGWLIVLGKSISKFYCSLYRRMLNRIHYKAGRM